MGTAKKPMISYNSQIQDKETNSKEKQMRAVVTVIGSDRIGIIAGISTVLAGFNVNILDINQTTMQELFTMIMMVDISKTNASFEKLTEALDAKGSEMGLKIRIQHEDIFKSMHRI